MKLPNDCSLFILTSQVRLVDRFNSLWIGILEDFLEIFVIGTSPHASLLVLCICCEEIRV